MVIGKRLSEERKKKGYTQEDLGKLLGVTKVSICGYERGNRTPTLENFIDLIKILDVSAEYLLGLDVKVIKEEETDYGVKLPKEIVAFNSELRKNRVLYNRIIDDPKRMVEVIIKKIDK